MERLNIKYIDQINAFHGWLLTNPIPASARIVWFSLMHFCNKTGWKAEFNLAMSALETDTGLSRRTIERARSILQESGLIHVKARQGINHRFIKSFLLCVNLTHNLTHNPPLTVMMTHKLSYKTWLTVMMTHNLSHNLTTYLDIKT